MPSTINGVKIDDTFAEAFSMKATRLILTAMTLKWAYRAANSLTGFASSVIACGCEADIERELSPDETPDGRPGIAVILFAMSTSQLEEQVTKRVGQSVMTTATSACFSGSHSEKLIPLGKNLRYFGDGHQISKMVNGTRYWRIPVMHGEFLCEETTGVVPAIGGGNFSWVLLTVSRPIFAINSSGMCKSSGLNSLITRAPATSWDAPPTTSKRSGLWRGLEPSLSWIRR